MYAKIVLHMSSNEQLFLNSRTDFQANPSKEGAGNAQLSKLKTANIVRHQIRAKLYNYNTSHQVVYWHFERLLLLHPAIIVIYFLIHDISIVAIYYQSLPDLKLTAAFLFLWSLPDHMFYHWIYTHLHTWMPRGNCCEKLTFLLEELPRSIWSRVRVKTGPQVVYY